MKFPPAFFVTGTDTGVGKTVVCAVLAKGLQACYWKPVQSGANEGTDTAWVQAVSELPPEHFLPESYVLQEPLSPHEAARIEGVSISLDNIRLPKTGNKPLVVEGAGGVLVPLNRDALMVDLISRLALPVVLVARSTLGTINHTLLSLQALRSHTITVLGVVMNGPLNAANRRAIEQYGDVQVIAEIPPLAALDRQSIESAFSCFQPTIHEAEAQCPAVR